MRRYATGKEQVNGGGGRGRSLRYLGYALPYRTLCEVDGGPGTSLTVTLRVTAAVFGSSLIATSAGRLGSEYWALRKMCERPA